MIVKKQEKKLGGVASEGSDNGLQTLKLCENDLTHSVQVLSAEIDQWMSFVEGQCGTVFKEVLSSN